MRGDGEIVEEIVSKEQQKEINKVMDIYKSHSYQTCQPITIPINSYMKT